MGSLFEMGQLPVQFDGHQHVLQNVDYGVPNVGLGVASKEMFLLHSDR